MNALVLIFLLAATVRQTDAKSGVSSVTIHAHDELCANATNANLDAVSVLTLLPPSTSTNVGPTKVPFFALFRKLGVLLVLNATGDDDEVLPMAVDVQMNAETGSSTNLKSIKLNRVGTSAAFASCASGPVWDFDEPFDVGAIATFTVKVFEDVNKLVDLPKGDLPHHAAEIQAPFPVLAQTKLNFMPNTDGTIIVVDSIFVSSGEYLPNGSCQTTPRTDRPLFVRTASHGLFDCKMTAPTKCTALPLPVSVSSNINNSDPSSYFSRSIDGTKGDMIFSRQQRLLSRPESRRHGFLLVTSRVRVHVATQLDDWAVAFSKSRPATCLLSRTATTAPSSFRRAQRTSRCQKM
jgi:hypothetical protein